MDINVEYIIALIIVVELLVLITTVLCGAFISSKVTQQLIAGTGMPLRVFSYAALLIQFVSGKVLMADTSEFTTIAGVALGLYFLQALWVGYLNFDALMSVTVKRSKKAIEIVREIANDRLNVWARLKVKRWRIAGTAALAVIGLMLIRLMMDGAYTKYVANPMPDAKWEGIGGIPSEHILFVYGIAFLMVGGWIMYTFVVDWGKYVLSIALPDLVIDEPEPEGMLSKLSTALAKRIKRPSASEA
jgi:hypothetical protein